MAETGHARLIDRDPAAEPSGLSADEPQSVRECSLDEVHARRGELVRLAYRFCWNLEDAEDAVQNALIIAARERRQVRDERKVWSWVQSIVVRQSLDLTRRSSRVRKAEADALDERSHGPTPPGPPDSVAADEMSDMVKRALVGLPEGQRTAIVLRHLEQMSYAKIAGLMGCKESTVRVHVRNAREALRRVIERTVSEH